MVKRNSQWFGTSSVWLCFSIILLKVYIFSSSYFHVTSLAWIHNGYPVSYVTKTLCYSDAIFIFSYCWKTRGGKKWTEPGKAANNAFSIFLKVVCCLISLSSLQFYFLLSFYALFPFIIFWKFSNTRRAC